MKSAGLGALWEALLGLDAYTEIVAFYSGIALFKRLLWLLNPNAFESSH